MKTKAAIVTGASSGIGLAISRALLDRGGIDRDMGNTDAVTR